MLDIIPDASKMAELSKAVDDERIQDELTKISKRIKEAAADGKTKINLAWNVPDEVKEVLKIKGYEVQHITQYNDSESYVTW